MIQHLAFALIGGTVGGLISPVFGIMGALFGFYVADRLSGAPAQDYNTDDVSLEGLGKAPLND